MDLGVFVKYSSGLCNILVVRYSFLMLLLLVTYAEERIY